MTTRSVDRIDGELDDRKLLTLVRGMLSDRSLDYGEQPVKAGPWGAVIRIALQSMGAEAELNPQPLPPRVAFVAGLARAVVDRVELMADIAETARADGGRPGVIIGASYLRKFTDDFCGTEFRLHDPFPGPRPHWYADRLDAIDLIVIATQFDRAAKETIDRDVTQALGQAATTFARAGVARLVG